MSNTTLTCFKDILNFLWLCSANDIDIKNGDRNNRSLCIIVISMERTYAKDTYISNIYVIATWIEFADTRSTCIGNICGAFFWDIESRVLAKLEVVLCKNRY